MFDELDEKIRKELLETERPLPETYEKRINQLKTDLPKQNRRWMPKVAIFIVCCLVGSTSIYAGVRHYIYRMEGVKKEDLQNMNHQVQDSEENADHYSRPLSKDESTKIAMLRKKYENGKFPQTTVKQYRKKGQVKGEELAYCIENSTFYLPEVPLSEEQMLQIIDFQYTRDYALEQEEGKESTELESEVQKKNAVCKAKEYLSLLYNLNADEFTSSVSNRELENHAAYHEVKFSNKKTDLTIEIGIVPGTNQLYCANADGGTPQNTLELDEHQYRDKAESIQKIAKKIWDEKLDKISFSYHYTKNKQLYRGKVKYYLTAADNSGYVFIYNAIAERIDSIYQYSNLAEEKKREKEADEALHQKDHVKRKYMTLKTGGNKK